MRTALVGLSLLGLLPWWATAVILGREVAITLMRTALLQRGLLPGIGGKLKCLVRQPGTGTRLCSWAGKSATRCHPG